MQRTDHTDDYMLYIPPPSMNLGGIQPEQAHLIDRIIRRFFSMELTKETIAQIIDNMPIKGNYVGLENEWITAHPDIETRSQPSAEAMDRARKICADIDPTSLDFDKRVSFLFLLFLSQVFSLQPLKSTFPIRHSMAFRWKHDKILKVSAQHCVAWRFSVPRCMI